MIVVEKQKRLQKTALNKGLNWLLPVSCMSGLILLWEYWIGDSLKFVLPRPSLIFNQFIQQIHLLLNNAYITIFEAFVGLAIGTVIGVLFSIGFVYSKGFAKSVYPYALILRSLPLMAILPILTSLMGPGYTSKITLIALASFFPVLINMVQGLTAINKTTIELMQSLNASKSEIFWKVRLPSSLPYLFTSLKITGSGAIVAAIISEYMYAVNGLGALMVSFMFGSRLLDLWATLLASTILSLLVYILIVFLEKILIPWGKHIKEG